MLQRLVYLAVGSTAVLVVVSFVLRFLSDIGPVATPEPQSIWRFEAAFLMTAMQWIAMAVVALSAISIVVLLFSSARARAS